MSSFQCAHAHHERRQKNVALTPEYEALLDHLKAHCGMSHSRVFRRGIELVAEEVATTLKGRELSLQA